MSILATCVIVYAIDRPSSLEIYKHELAHCNGWTHAEPASQKSRSHFVSGKHKAHKPPLRFITPYRGKLITHEVDSNTAYDLCGSLGCQWFED